MLTGVVVERLRDEVAVGPLRGFRSLSFRAVPNEPAGFELLLDPSSPLVDEFATPNRDGLRVTVPSSGWWWSGAVAEVESDADAVKVHGVSHTSWLARRLVVTDSDSTADGTYPAEWTAVGTPTAVYAALISEHAGATAPAGRAPFVTTTVDDPDPLSPQPSMTFHGRFEPLLDAIADRAGRNNVAVEVAADGNGSLVATCRQGRMLPHIVFDDRSRSLDQIASRHAATATAGWAAGAGEGAARPFTYGQVAADPRDRVEVFVEAAATDTTGERSELITETLTDGAASAAVSFRAADHPHYRFGVDYRLGDHVSVNAGGVQSLQRVAALEVTIGQAGVAAVLEIGQPEEPLSKLIRDADKLAARVRVLEAR